jgi:dolichol-phosphate mannosyltransferase
MDRVLPVIIIPTYNERENIEMVVRDILNLECGVSILIVDDNSPDGTGEIADRLSDEFPEVHVRHRPGKQGLGPAYRYGFGEALDMGATCVFEMDADYSHNPGYIPQFLSAIGDHDLVIGSRYVKGGGVENWGFSRKLISRGGNIFANLCTGLKVKDMTSGYRCYRSDVLKAVDLSRISASGYGFQVEIAYVCTLLGFDVFELPIIFTDRCEGESKMSGHIVWEATWMVAGLKRKYRDLR